MAFHGPYQESCGRVLSIKIVSLNLRFLVSERQDTKGKDNFLFRHNYWRIANFCTYSAVKVHFYGQIIDHGL